MFSRRQRLYNAEARFTTFLAHTLEGSNRFLSAEEMIRTAAFGGAAALGLENEIGTLKTGKQADLIVIALNNIAQMPVRDVILGTAFRF